MVSHSTKHEQALCMPTCTHLYERSCYNVVNYFSSNNIVAFLHHFKAKTPGIQNFKKYRSSQDNRKGGRIIDNLQIVNLQIDNLQIDKLTNCWQIDNWQIVNWQIDNLQIDNLTF